MWGLLSAQEVNKVVLPASCVGGFGFHFLTCPEHLHLHSRPPVQECHQTPGTRNESPFLCRSFWVLSFSGWPWRPWQPLPSKPPEDIRRQLWKRLSAREAGGTLDLSISKGHPDIGLLPIGNVVDLRMGERERRGASDGRTFGLRTFTRAFLLFGLILATAAG